MKHALTINTRLRAGSDRRPTDSSARWFALAEPEIGKAIEAGLAVAVGSRDAARRGLCTRYVPSGGIISRTVIA